MAAIELHQVDKVYADGHQAIYRLSLNVPDGEFLGYRPTLLEVAEEAIGAAGNLPEDARKRWVQAWKR